MFVLFIISNYRIGLPTSSEEEMYNYRHVELIVTMLNYTVVIYLTSFPSMLFLVVALLLFGTIRVWHLDPRGNVVFPACMTRCGFEAMTLTMLAGRVNLESTKVIVEWKYGGRSKLARKFQQSCRSIKCAAGSMYTFESSIVITSLDNLIALTCNLLVAIE